MFIIAGYHVLRQWVLHPSYCIWYDMEDDVAVIVCGGAAKNAFGIINSEDRNPWDLYDISEKEFGHHFDVLSNSFSTIPIDDNEKIMEALDDKRICLTFTILGGELGTDVVKDVIRCAREKGCKVVSVFGIPMDFEKERRERAFSNLHSVVALSDCTLVADMQKSFEVNLEYNKDKQWTTFLRNSDSIMRNSIKAIVDFMQGPFFSVFVENLYSFVPSYDVLPVNAVMRSWDQMMFDNGRATDRSVIMLGSNVKSAEIEDIRSRVAMMCGTLPEIVIREDSDDSKVMIFRAVRSF